MEITKLKVTRREAAGTRACRRLRRTGQLPGIIYGHGQAPESVAVSAHELSGILDDGTHLLELALNGGTQQVLIKDVQFDPLDGSPIHVDFTRVDLTERVTVSVPLEFKGTPVGTHEGGVLEYAIVDVEIECLVSEIPDSIRVNVGDMKLGDLLHVSDLVLPPSMKAVTPDETIVCSVRAKAVAVEAEAEVSDEEGEQQPEIIGRKEKEEDEESDAGK